VNGVKLTTQYSYIFPALMVALDYSEAAPADPIEVHVLLADLNLKSQEVYTNSDCMNFSLIASSDYEIFMVKSFKERVEFFKLGNGVLVKPDYTYAGTKGQKLHLNTVTIIEKVEKKLSSLLAYNDLEDKKSLLRISVKQDFLQVEEFFPLSILSMDESIEGMCVFDSEIIAWNLGLTKKKIWSSRANFRRRKFSTDDLKILPITRIFIGEKDTSSTLTALTNV